ncbi:T9SS type A sorting domain-containing protein [Phaeodactylibacter xiamenensis]|uniref:T9SS type A sorting domain-containing protein n=1 Tax=Phaeodactylibacter xiamenensis TaxID=1524460 RepID=UPI003CCBB47A
MKRSFTLRPFWFILLPFLLGSSTLNAQTSCEYTLNLFDSFGDGWNGGFLDVTIGNTTTTYTLDNFNDDGSFNSFALTVTEGDTIILDFTVGGFGPEVSYNLVDAEFTVIFEDGLVGAPLSGVAFTASAVCPSCPPPPTGGIDIENIRAFRADVSLIPSDPEGSTIIELGEAGFMPGMGTFKTISGASTTLFNLSENTGYEVYLSAACANGDTSITIGPYPFFTPFANDVGVVELLDPVTACNLGIADSITLAISNFGGAPQTLIPYNFAVNGIPGGVNMPTDGLFTGVIGTDSTDIAQFDAPYDLSEPGEYLFEIWTDLEGDSVRTNDTTRVLIVNIPEVTTYPYYQTFEEWGGGWTVEQNGTGEATWEYGVPAGTLINSAVSGENAWVTNLDGDYNNSEISYLISPCLDFSSLDEDPRIAFFMNFESESCCDELWLEVSTDDGETWSKVGVAGTGVNWYNDTFNNWWDGTAGFEGWAYVQNILANTAGEADVKVRFVFSSDGSVPREGIGLDNILIGPTIADDMAASGITTLEDVACGSPDDQVTFTIRNVGDEPQQNIPVAYSVNGGPVVMETTGLPIVFPGDQFVYTFEQTFDSSVPGIYEVRAWAMLDGDGFLANDTTMYRFQTASQLPYKQDFEAGGVPDDWEVSPSVTVSNGHNNASFAIHANIWSFNDSISLEMPVLGPVEAGDTLRFDYRYVEYFAGTEPTVLTDMDSLKVGVSTDCGETYTTVFTVSDSLHVPSVDMTTVTLPLEEYAGEYIRVRFQGIWGEGDYWLDIDNINIRRCSGITIDSTITGASAADMTDGSIAVLPTSSEGPYIYEWSTGDSTRVVSDLGVGEYTVTITDGFGCQDVKTFVVDVMVGTIELDNIGSVNLAPNPTSGQSTLTVAFKQPVDARIQVLNTMGQLLYETVDQQVTEGTYPIDLSRYNSGMYWVRIFANGQVKTAKLIKAGL